MAEDVSGFPKGYAAKELQMPLMDSKGALCPRDRCITVKYTAKNQDSMASCNCRDRSVGCMTCIEKTKKTSVTDKN